MAIKAFKPTTNGRRGMTTKDTDMVTSKRGVKSLLKIRKQNAGRNNTGRITIRHRGGGVKRFYRLVNHRLAPGTTATIEAIEYDPNRSARIARIKDQHGLYHYVIADGEMRVGQQITSGAEAPVETGNRLPLANIPTGTFIYNIELQPGKGGQMVRSAGAKAQLLAKEGDYATLRLPSGEMRRVRIECMATLGSVGNEQHQNVKLGSAGRRRRMGWRPSVHGKAMNPADHPMGGGEGKTGPGRNPKTPWGKPALGYKTRRRQDTNKYIVRSRHEAKRK
ncbi:MAG TPA: 50S ribosomal protein L2 [Candidatus Saccharimonadales bacterium]|nr:50S ribosomal protein L2 [Candidatus Saccharimonadales bacterium]